MTRRGSSVDIRTVKFGAADEFYPDTNFWMFNYGPKRARQSSRAPIYQDAAQRIKRVGCVLYTDEMILSEFANACFNIAHDQAREGGHKGGKKPFRRSRMGKRIAADIAAKMKRILRRCVFITGICSHEQIDWVIDQFARGIADFNDLLLVVRADDNNWSIISDDIDVARTPTKKPTLTATPRRR